MIKKLTLTILVSITTLTTHAMLPPGKVSTVQGKHSSGYRLKLDDTNTLYCMRENTWEIHFLHFR